MKKLFAKLWAGFKAKSQDMRKYPLATEGIYYHLLKGKGSRTQQAIENVEES